jgi:hypothetical protein
LHFSAPFSVPFDSFQLAKIYWTIQGPEQGLEFQQLALALVALSNLVKLHSFRKFLHLQGWKEEEEEGERGNEEECLDE